MGSYKVAKYILTEDRQKKVHMKKVIGKIIGVSEAKTIELSNLLDCGNDAAFACAAN